MVSIERKQKGSGAGGKREDHSPDAVRKYCQEFNKVK